MPRTPWVALAATALLLAACAEAAPPTPAAAPRPVRPDPAATAGDGAGDHPGSATGGRAAPRAHAAEEIVLEIPAGTLPDGRDAMVTVRSAEAGGRHEVEVDTPAGVVDRHVFTDEEHWWWILPAAREVVDVEWVHLDHDDLEAAGDRLPQPVADARVLLPRPGEVDVGVVLAGREVVAVRHVGPDEDRIELAGLDGEAVLRRRSLPAGSVIDVPARSTPLRELPSRLRG